MKSWSCILIALALLSCGKENADGWEKSILDGGYFTMANTIRFYYVDAGNEGLIDPDKPETLPYTYPNGEKPTDIAVPDDFDKNGSWLYNGNFNGIARDEAENRYYGTTYLQGDKSKHTYTFYMSSAGSVDQFDVTYSYKRGGAVGGDGIAVRVDELKVNGVRVANDANMQNRQVFITKVDGKTTSVTAK